MLFNARSRTLALVAVPMLAAAGATAGVVLSSTSAHAAATGFTYAVGINTGTDTIVLGHLKTAVVQHNLLTVAHTMTADEAALAATDLGGAARVGFEVTKVFDNSDKAASVASLVQTSVTNAGLWTYYNGALCDHIQARPVFVASVDHPTVQSNSTTSVTETIQFVGRSFIQVVPNTCPTEPAIPTTGTYFVGSMTKSGKTYSFPSVHSFLWSQSESNTLASLTPGEQSNYKSVTGKLPSQEITFTHGLDASDEKLGLSSFVGSTMTSSTWTFSQYKDGVRQYTITLQNPFIADVTFASMSSGPRMTVTIAFTGLKIDYVGGP